LVSEIFGRIGGPRDETAESTEEPVVLEPNPKGARWLRRHLAGGVVALTTVVDEVYRASTVTACAIVSLEPLQLLVSIELYSQMEGWLLESRIFGLSVLPWDQQFFADQFAGFAPLASRRFAGIDHFSASTGAPLLSRATVWADCRIVADVETGDHRCFIGAAVAIGRGQGDIDDPLLYYLNRYRRLR
jgi:flavin reductase (DIM6/NTAB) family NADH-FMN oxidoreductase RutF